MAHIRGPYGTFSRLRPWDPDLTVTCLLFTTLITIMDLTSFPVFGYFWIWGPYGVQMGPQGGVQVARRWRAGGVLRALPPPKFIF